MHVCIKFAVAFLYRGKMVFPRSSWNAKPSASIAAGVHDRCLAWRNTPDVWCLSICMPGTHSAAWMLQPCSIAVALDWSIFRRVDYFVLWFGTNAFIKFAVAFLARWKCPYPKLVSGLLRSLQQTLGLQMYCNEVLLSVLHVRGTLIVLSCIESSVTVQTHLHQTR